MARRKSSKFSDKSNFSDAVKTLRKYADGFDASNGYDIRKGYSNLTPYQKRKLAKYLKVISEQTAKPFKVVRPRKKERLKSLQKFSQQDKQLRDLKVAFVPVSDPTKKLEIKYKGDKVEKTIEGGQVVKTEFWFDDVLLATDPEAAIQELLDEGASEADRVLLMAGKYEIPQAMSADLRIIAERVRNLQNRYGNENKNNYYGNWMHGLIAITFKGTVTPDQYFREKRKVKDLLAEYRSAKTSEKRRAQLRKELQKYNLDSYRKKR